MFLAVEGVEGTGKTTFAKQLAEELKLLGHDVVVSREPGGCALGERVRDVFHDPSIPHITNDAEMMLIFASRVEHMRETVIPALEEGKVVICDRHLATTYAYQVAGQRNPTVELFNSLRSHYRHTADLPVPEVTFHVKAHTDTLVRRIANREEGNSLNRVERLLMSERERFEDIKDGFGHYFEHYERGEVIEVNNNGNEKALMKQIKQKARGVDQRVRGTVFNYPSLLDLGTPGLGINSKTT